jgi:hypothetical protein
MTVDVEQLQLAGGGADHVVVPDLVEQRTWSGGHGGMKAEEDVVTEPRTLPDERRRIRKRRFSLAWRFGKV